MSDSSPALGGPRHVAVFESRMGEALAGLVARQGWVPHAAPTLREVPIEDNQEARRFGERLLAGEFDVVVFLTGVGTRFLAEVIESAVPRETWIGALSRAFVVARGPKPTAALRELRARVDVQIPEPNTWREILETLDRIHPVGGKRIAVQEYGQSNPDLIAALEARGATVTSVPVYRWALPEDVGPLRGVLREIAEGRIDAALFTSAQQVRNVFDVAGEMGLAEAVRGAFAGRTAVGSIGPTTTETLAEFGITPAFEPEHPKMGHLASALAEFGGALPRIAGGAAPRTADPKTTSDERLRESRFLKACRREPTDVTPIWLMRQAGRYMAEYREVRAKYSFLELCKRPEVACEVTVTAAERLGVDAAILFADILLILEPLGFELEFAKGEGPVIHNPIRSPEDVSRMRPFEDPGVLQYVYEAVRLIRRALPGDLPLIGFAGAPFTLACYAIEGGGSRHYERAKAFMLNNTEAWDRLMAGFTRATAAYLRAQHASGAQALQLFDSWVGSLSPADYRRFVQPHMRALFAELPADVPTIHFGTDTGGLLEHQRDAGGTVIGLDWRVELDAAWERLGPGVAVQGNLDPVVLLGPPDEVRRQADRILRQAGGRPGHIFNLGHGILPSTPVDNVRMLVDFVHQWTIAP